ncbi:MAG: hypothetical protein K0R34_3492 [Herbinix sp.]|nr:hypothetical protein [Herbinix sp.]
MLYTVRPLERIYARPASYPDIKQEKPKDQTEAQFREVTLQHGRVVTRREGDAYVVEGVNSTDMQDYLNEKYSPGQDIKL